MLNKQNSFVIAIVAALIAGALYLGKSSAPPAPTSVTSPQAAGASVSLPAKPTAQPSISPSRIKAASTASVRDLDLGSFPQLDKPLSPQIPGLRERAEHGDTQAAITLWSFLDSCERALKENSKVDHIKDPHYRQAELERQSRSLDNCEGVTATQIAERYRFLEQAAAMGDPKAQFRYAIAGSDVFGGTNEALRHPDEWHAYQDIAKSYLEGLAQQCNSTVILNFRNAYSFGNQMYEPDTTKALMYYLISTKLNTDPPRNPAFAQRILDLHEKGLSPDQITSAMQNAENFYNENCRF